MPILAVCPVLFSSRFFAFHRSVPVVVNTVSPPPCNSHLLTDGEDRVGLRREQRGHNRQPGARQERSLQGGGGTHALQKYVRS